MLHHKTIFLQLFLFLGLMGLNSSVFAKGNNSDFFKDVVFQDGGDFLSMNLGDSKEEVMSKMPESALEDASDSYVYYSWKLGAYDYYIDLFFTEDDKLSSIDGYVYFYDKNGKELVNEADKLYKDMKAYFVKRYEGATETNSDGMKYTYWYLDDKDVEVGMSGGEVYWYLYDYSYDDYYYDDVEPTPVHLADIEIGKNGVFMPVDILDSRAKVKSTLSEDNFSYAGLNNLEYTWDLGSNYYYVNYVFDENDLLTLVDAQIDFAYSYYYDYDSEDTSYAKQFYDEMKAYLNNKYGTRKEKTIHGETKTISWRFEGKELVLGLTYDNVYWYYSKDE